MNRAGISEAVGDIRLVERVYYFDELASTSDYARNLVDSTPNPVTLHGSLVIAAHQAAGRGRFGRSWEAPPGKALLFSLVLAPEFAGSKTGTNTSSPGVQEVARVLSIAAPVAVCEGIRGSTGVEATLKYPNDVLVSGRKLAGILLEQAGPAGNTFVLGIGINVNQDADEFPSGLRLPATSIALELGRKVCMVEVLRNVTLSLDFHWQAFDLASASAKMNALCFTIGRHVEAITPRGLIQGTALSITPEGALVILTDSGRQEAVFSGEVRELKFS